MTDHRVSGWKKFETVIYASRRGTNDYREEATDVLGTASQWECTCGDVFTTEEEAINHVLGYNNGRD